MKTRYTHGIVQLTLTKRFGLSSATTGAEFEAKIATMKTKVLPNEAEHIVPRLMDRRSCKIV